MSNIVGLDGQPKMAPEQTYDYNFVMNDGTEVVEHGLLSFNPVFAVIVDEDGKLLFAIPMANLKSIKRL